MSHHLVGVFVVAGVLLSLLVLVRKQITVTFVTISVAIIIGYWGWFIIGSEDQDLATIRRDAETARAKQDAAIRHDFKVDACASKTNSRTAELLATRT
jgi:hypothetical protein